MLFGNVMNKAVKGSKDSKRNGIYEEAIEKANLNQSEKEKETSFVKSKSVDEVRRSFTVCSVNREQMNVLQGHQVCIVVRETSSEKTNQLAQYIEEED